MLRVVLLQSIPWEHKLGLWRKLALNVLKMYEIGKKHMILKMKRFAIGNNPEKHLESILILLVRSTFQKIIPSRT